MHKEKLSTDDFRVMLKNNGFKITAARLEILKIFSTINKPVNASFIFNKLIKKTNEVTVYRIISSFEEKGLLKKVDLRKDSTYFELNADHHHHMVCVKCGEIEDFIENREIEKILKKVIGESKKFKKIKEHSLELFGYCKECY